MQQDRLSIQARSLQIQTGSNPLHCLGNPSVRQLIYTDVNAFAWKNCAVSGMYGAFWQPAEILRRGERCERCEDSENEELHYGNFEA